MHATSTGLFIKAMRMVSIINPIGHVCPTDFDLDTAAMAIMVTEEDFGMAEDFSAGEREVIITGHGIVRLHGAIVVTGIGKFERQPLR